MSKHEKQIIVIGIILSIVFLNFLNPLTNSNPTAPTAEQGILDLSQWDFEEDGLVGLNGDWEFYEDQLLSPDDFLNSTTNLYQDVPSVGSQKQSSSVINQDGFATYRLTVNVGEKYEQQIFGVKINDIRMAHKLFVNGQFIGQSGLIGVSNEEHKIGNIPYAAYFNVDQETFDIIIQVSKYDYYDGGIIGEIDFGLREDISKLSLISFGTDLSIIFVLLLFSVYKVVTYSMGRQRNTFYLYNGLFFISLLITFSCRNEKIFMMSFPMIPMDISYKIQDITAYSAIIFIFLSLWKLDRDLTPKWSIRIFCYPMVAYILAVAILPYSVYTHMEIAILFFAGGSMSFILISLVWVYFKRKYEDEETRESILLSILFIFLFLMYYGSINLFDILAALTGQMIEWDTIMKTRSQVMYELGEFREISIVIFVALMYILLALRNTNTVSKLERMSKRLLSMNKMKDEFLAITSHELKTPLHGIMNISSYLLEEKGRISDEQKENLSLIHDTSIKLSNLVNDLIDVSRLKNGEIKLQTSRVDMKVSTQIVFDVLAFEVKGKKIDLVNNISKGTLVIADESRVRQILYNLIHNAIKHTKQGQVTVTSHLVGDTLTISVEDTGIGIPVEKREKVFGYFEQLDQPLPQDGYHSMGLGLYISRQLVEKMEGEMWVDWSEVGEGTRFSFTLPFSKIENLPEQSTVESDQQMQSTAFSQSELEIDQKYEQTILIVDDESTNIRILFNLLTKQHYNVITAYSGKEALAKLSQHKEIDLVISDVMMPEMSGLDLCKKIRETRSLIKLPILLATVKDMPGDIDLGFKAGANDYVTKPFDTKTILARIQTLLSMKVSMEEAFQNELAFLQAQIKPHFLHNALSTIASLCYTDVQEAIRLLKMLNIYLRIIYHTDPTTMFVPLKQELQLVEAFVEIEKVRFDWLYFTLNIEDSLNDDVVIPALSIQPLVENAIRHGLFKQKGERHVSLKIEDHNAMIRVIVEDNGIGISEDVLEQFKKGEIKNAGIGMTNIKKRLDSLQGATINIESAAGQGTKITLELNKKYDIEFNRGKEERYA
ncbi:ATP-binding protein [Chengkuizengella axinellae]|uniref:histidine kinase n=1 Tax=Chengkuizengella axinellae TaxID=3064388 RepID=A0ABT9J111_9BACL|nr:ATP-binding protein [Chengkuizengella sp. 2205SS18-9]MDP5275287.1 ATP-binding protein [Chengkuizengella sp. 2205SS18-9]